MRAGRLKTRKYKTRRRGVGVLCLALIILALGLAARAMLTGRLPGLPFLTQVLPKAAQPEATLPPEDLIRETRDVVLPGKSWYALQLSSSADTDVANAEASALQVRGAAGYVFFQETYLVLGAAYETRSDAQAVADQLKSLHGIAARVAPIDRPEITLRLTGRRAQLSALEDAYLLIDQTAEQMSALSRGIDSRTLDAQAARASLSSQLSTAGAMRERLTARFGENPADPAVRDLIAMLDELSRAVDAALLESGAARLGAKIKYGQLLCVCRMANHAALLQSGRQ